jgi:protein O-GlcNAc transferase
VTWRPPGDPAMTMSDPRSDHYLKTALEHQRSGDLAEARRLYRLVLSETPNHTVALFRGGLLELQDGRPEAALALIEQAVSAAPDEPRHHFGLGQSLQALRRHEEAAAAYRRVLQADPHSADAYFALGTALQSFKDYANAIGAFEAAVHIQPEYSAAFNNLGNCQQLLGRLPQAAAAYGQALTLQPGNAGAMSNLGAVLQEMGRLDEAVELLRAAVDLQPLVAAHAVNLGIALCRQREFDAAETLLRRALQREANNTEVEFNLANALQGLGRFREAAQHYRHAVDLRPGYAEALNNLGNAHKALGEFALAEAAYASAISARPDYIVALNNLGCLLRTLGRFEEAEQMLRRGLDINPRHCALLDNLGSVLKDAGDLDAAIDCFRAALKLDPGNAATHSNLAYAQSFQSPDAQVILEECLRWNARFAAPLSRDICSHPNDLSAARRLRIGYVSADFRDHCQSLFTIPLLSRHDHSAFEIFCYSSVQRADELTRRIAGLADVWREVGSLDDAALAAMIRRDGIDVLIDLTMHMANGRPLLFARKPAPIQVAWLAYPGTTGIGAMDYRFSDGRLDPSGAEVDYSERTIRLPDSFWCYDPLTEQPQVNALPALERGHVTFGCLNNPCKLTDATLYLWGDVMRALPDSRLCVLAPPGHYRGRILRRFSALHIGEERISFVPFRMRADYLCSYHGIDLGLDTIPYNGHTTSLDSLWMGVPTITRVGPTCVGRGGLSQLFQLNLLEFAATSDIEFTRIAIALANDLPRLAELRRGLRARLEQSPLMNAGRFANHIEAAYRAIWSDYCHAGIAAS